MVSSTDPSTTLIADLSRYSSTKLDSNNDVAGAISDGFRTTALPAEIAPMTGSRDSTRKQRQFTLLTERSLIYKRIVL